MSLHAVLKEVEETLDGQSISPTRQARLETITSGCGNLLEDLQAVVKQYESLGTQSKRTWDRVNWDAEQISELRARLTSNTVMLTAFMRYEPASMLIWNQITDNIPVHAKSWSSKS